MRSALFNALFYAYSFAFLLGVLPLTLLPSRRPLARALRFWARGVLVLMHGVMGIRVTVDGLDRLPRDGGYILAGKHQSECDGIVLLAKVPDLACIAMKELAGLPLAGPILRKLEMVLIDTEGGRSSRDALIDGSRAAAMAGRPIVIYPEGTLMAVGEAGPYRAGVYHLACALDLPVFPVATNVGLRWDRRQFRKTPGRATVEILPPLLANADKSGFMQELQDILETRSNRLATTAETMTMTMTTTMTADPPPQDAQRGIPEAVILPSLPVPARRGRSVQAAPGSV